MPRARIWRRRRFQRRRNVNVFRRYRQKSARLFRRFIRKRARPELKFSTNVIETGNIDPNTAYSQKLTPETISVGANRFERVGDKLKFVKVVCMFHVTDNSSTLLTAPSVNSAVVRLIIWSPRIDIEPVVSAFNGLTEVNALVDPNLCTVHRDTQFTLSPPYMAEALDNERSGGPRPREWLKRFDILFPRHVYFGNTAVNPSGFVDEEKYSLYFTIINGDLNNVASVVSRTYFYDA